MAGAALEVEEAACASDSGPGAGALSLAYDEAIHLVMTGCYPCDFERVGAHTGCASAAVIHRELGEGGGSMSGARGASREQGVKGCHLRLCVVCVSLAGGVQAASLAAIAMHRDLGDGVLDRSRAEIRCVLGAVAVGGGGGVAVGGYG